MTTVYNQDSRRMQPLPWRKEPPEPGKCISLYSESSGKQICSFWGGNERENANLQWCTAVQMERHADYAMHACNWFPHVQTEIERIYNMEDMPEEAIKAIEELMQRCYCPEVPPYAK